MPKLSPFCFLLLLLSFNVSAACSTYWDAEAYGETQMDSLALYNLRGVPIAHVTTAHLKKLVEIKNRLTFAAHTNARLLLCDDTGPAAFATNDNGARYVVFSIAILNLLNWDANAIAGVMGHEVAHLEFNHSHLAQGKKALAAAKTILFNVANQNSASAKGAAGLIPLQISANDVRTLATLLYFKFSRDDEQQADDEGIRLLTRAGINPTGSFNALAALFAKVGDVEGTYTSMHPSLKARLAKSAQYLATSGEAKQVLAELQVREITNEDYRLTAEEYVKRKTWQNLGTLTERWLSRGDGDENAMAHYYRGIYVRNGLSDAAAARKLFYKAVQLDPDNSRARLELCVALFEEGRKLESVYCFRNIANGDDKENFKARTFGENLWTGGEIEPFTSVVVTHEAGGSKYVTNLELAKQKHLEVHNLWAE